MSVIIPCYNQAHFLPEAIESALSQTNHAMDVIVVDDGSSDNTAEVVARYPGVRCVRQENRGVAEARNAGFHISRGEYVLFLDADDRLTPNAVESHLSCFAKNPEAGFVVADTDIISLDGSYVGPYGGRSRLPVLEASRYEELLTVNHACNTIAAMFCRSVIERLGGFNGWCSPADDYEILLRAAWLFPGAQHRTVVAEYRRYPGSISRKGTVMLRALHRVMEMQLPIVKGNPRLVIAWRQGDRYFRGRYGLTTLKQIYEHLRHWEIWQATSAAALLLWYVRGRLFIFPWIFRYQWLNYLRRRLRAWRDHEGRSLNTFGSR